MFQLLHPLVRAIQPYLTPICFCLTWGVILLFAVSIGRMLREGIASAKRMHQVPCPYCQFFTNDHRLKCTVHPTIANSEAAIRCPDYCQQKHPYYSTREVV